MAGRETRATVGFVVVLAVLAVFVVDAFKGVAPSWMSLGTFIAFGILGLLLIDAKLGKAVLQDVLSKASKKIKRR